jgi:hypothetical protein
VLQEAKKKKKRKNTNQTKNLKRACGEYERHDTLQNIHSHTDTDTHRQANCQVVGFVCLIFRAAYQIGAKFVAFYYHICATFAKYRAVLLVGSGGGGGGGGGANTTTRWNASSVEE